MTDQTPAPADDAGVSRDDLVKQAISDLGEAKAPDVEPAGKAPDPEPEPPQADAEAGEPPAEDEPTDIWADAPDPLRTAYQSTASELEALKTAHERTRNQIPGMNRKIAELQRELRAAAAKPSPPPQAADLDERLERLREDYPEIAEQIGEVLRAQDARLQSLTAAQEAAVEDAALTQQATLEGKHPDWLETIQQHSDAFTAFVNDPEQPAWVARAFEANREAITDAKATIRMIDRFKEQIGQARPQTPPQADTPPDTRTSDRRQRQLAGSSTPPPRGAGAVTSGAPPDRDRKQLERWATAQVFGS